MRGLSWLTLTVIAFCLSLAVSWLLLKQINFAYEWLYTLIDIPAHIAQYGPVYTERADFVQTTDAERYRLFAEVVTAIHQQGTGLAALNYHSPEGQVLNTAFNHDEVVHLQDVAILIDRMTLIVAAMLVIFIGLLIYLFVTAQALPSFTALLLYVLIALAVVAVAVLLIGPVEVFAQLHVWVFPAEHKWKFYYEESVMSNLMKAPDLFGYIAMLLVAVAVPIFAVVMWLVKQLLALRSTTNA